MEQEDRLKYLKIALNVIGVMFIVGLPAMMIWIWPSGWGWTPPQPEYEHMIMGVYATLGVFLIMAAKDPLAMLRPALIKEPHSALFEVVHSVVSRTGVEVTHSDASARQHGQSPVFLRQGCSGSNRSACCRAW